MIAKVPQCGIFCITYYFFNQARVTNYGRRLFDYSISTNTNPDQKNVDRYTNVVEFSPERRNITVKVFRPFRAVVARLPFHRASPCVNILSPFIAKVNPVIACRHKKLDIDYLKVNGIDRYTLSRISVAFRFMY